jgi:hypothetical protein
MEYIFFFPLWKSVIVVVVAGGKGSRGERQEKEALHSSSVPSSSAAEAMAPAGGGDETGESGRSLMIRGVDQSAAGGGKRSHGFPFLLPHHIFLLLILSFRPIFFSFGSLRGRLEP